MDRKALARGYKESPRAMGVFQVRNLVSGRVFIGASTDLWAMLNRQRAQLQMGSHPNRRLQADWRDQGAEAFTFEALDTLAPTETPDYDPAEDLRVLEAIWMEKLAPFGERGYHSEPKSSA